MAIGPPRISSRWGYVTRGQGRGATCEGPEGKLAERN